MKQLKVSEERLVEAYEERVAEAVKGGVEEVNEGVVKILKKAESEDVEKVDLSGSQLRILPEAFGRIRGLVVLNLSSNQLEVCTVLCLCFVFFVTKRSIDVMMIGYDVFVHVLED